MKLIRATTTVPLQLVIGIFYIKQLLGSAGILGIILLVIVVYLTRKLIARAKKIDSKLGKANDQRLAVINEVVQGMSSVKLMGWKLQFVQAIGSRRHKQLSMMWKRAKVASLINLCTIGSFPFVVFATLAVYSLQNELNAEVLFTAIAVFKIIQRSVDMLPSLVSYTTSLYVSFQRIEAFLNQQEIQDLENRVENDRVGFKNATLVWNANSSFKLKNLNVQFPNGELSVIGGSTGSGKSSLLLALVGNMELIEGCVSVPIHFDANSILESRPVISDIAYVSQEPWLRNATIRDNILFGEPFNYERYETVLHMCALLPDMALFKAGDLTEIGERGITLSGGQRQRIALARAIYSSRKILLIDDCLSAVDAHTGKHILHKCLLSTNSLMSGRTRILVTHHLSMCLPYASYMVMIDDGQITFQGPPEKVCPNPKAEVEVLSNDSSSSNTSCLNDSLAPIGTPLINTPIPSRTSTEITLTSGRLTEDEVRVKGAIHLNTWNLYFKACGKQWFLVLCFGYIIIMQFLNMYKDYYLSVKLDRHEQSRNLVAGEIKWLVAYLAFGALSATISSLGLLISYYGSKQASILLHTSLTESILNAKMRWLETIPTGRLISRFGSDMQEIDDNIMPGILDVLRPLVALLLSLLVISVKFSQFYIIGTALLAVYIYYTLQFMQIQREVKRMDSIAFAPVISLYGELISGSRTIRAFGLESEFVAEMIKRYFIYHKAEFTKRSASRWMRIRISMTGSFVTFAMVMIIVANSHLIKTGLAGFIMVQTVGILQETLVAVRKYSDLELSLTAVERVNQYLHIEHEPSLPQNHYTLPASWPTSGNLAVNSLVTGYTSNTPILHNLSFTISHGEKIGVVGRTGAGKSSLTLALLRLIEPTSGNIVLDGVDIANVDLETLRKSVTIIPQNPVLFNGTIRFNLDPFNEYPDAILLDALQHTLLLKGTEVDSKNIAAFHSLDDLVMSNGQNLSLGQRQLVALARALVRRSHLVILDEATAAVDFENDSLIQQTIRGPEFANATMLCIAHRLHTIIDYDRIMVLNEGKIVEFDKPDVLLRNEKGYFRHLCENSNDFNIMQRL
ncbi:hypothetical protein IWW36_003238 [Coemansia brasiliensis]|uniref:P-loop containing nucleoside triphosphate hydrolase protein n=1 Tax=Coemansia brasiliensis TaxID=2650707 RepID=A0A9W8I5S7_9FUNG|nr:hypothetical protein IWW36_003238 [Coemansia brasiliensis]